MLIECRIKRAGGTHVDMPNPDESTTAYHFRPLDPSRADSPHVADVSNMAHVSRFIAADCTVYVPFEGKAGAAPLPKAPTAPAPTAPAPAAEAPAAQVADTNQDGRLSVSELSAGIVAGQFTPEKLREMLALEEESGAPRKGFVRAITQALKA